jgi:hypothetical protein
MRLIALFAALLLASLPVVAQEPVSETPCATSCNIPGLPPTACGEDIHDWHSSLNLCTNYGYVNLPEGGSAMVVGQGTCNIAWQDGTEFRMTCAYGNCEGSGTMLCGGVEYEVDVSCAGGPQGNQSDVARATFGHDLAACNGFGNGMRAQCTNGTYTFSLWD